MVNLALESCRTGALYSCLRPRGMRCGAGEGTALALVRAHVRFSAVIRRPAPRDVPVSDFHTLHDDAELLLVAPDEPGLDLSDE